MYRSLDQNNIMRVGLNWYGINMRKSGHFISDVNISHKSKATVTTANDIMIQIIFKGRLPYIGHYCPRDAHMRDIKQEEIMTSPGKKSSSLLDGTVNASKCRLKQFPSAPIDVTDNLYNIEGNIIVQRSDTDNDSITSNNSSNSSVSRHCSYWTRTRKEKQKRQHKYKLSLLTYTESIMWYNGYVSNKETDKVVPLTKYFVTYLSWIEDRQMHTPFCPYQRCAYQVSG